MRMNSVAVVACRRQKMRVYLAIFVTVAFSFACYTYSAQTVSGMFKKDHDTCHGDECRSEKKSQMEAGYESKQQAGSKPSDKIIQDEVSKSEKVIDSQKEMTPERIDVIITFTNAKQNYHFQNKFELTVTSMLEHASVPLAIHIIGDDDSQVIAAKILKRASQHAKSTYSMVRLDMDKLAHQLAEVIKPMQDHFSYKPGAYYNDAFFFLSIALHLVMPEHMSKVIMLDSDLKFKEDIKKLYNQFHMFKGENIIGLARDLQPVYRHTFWSYRNNHPNTRVGAPPPDGLTGFNSGVILLDLQRMRDSKLYNKMLDGKKVHVLAKDFDFKGHLGDQDFFTLLNMKYEQLFHVLPCTWNRQLCTWWRDNGYADVFSQYHNCKGKVNIYHGNCDTPIPDT